MWDIISVVLAGVAKDALQKRGEGQGCHWASRLKTQAERTACCRKTGFPFHVCYIHCNGALKAYSLLVGASGSSTNPWIEKQSILSLHFFFLVVAEVKTKRNFYADLGCNLSHCNKLVVKASVQARSQLVSQLSAVMVHLLFILEPSDFVSLNYRNEMFHHWTFWCCKCSKWAKKWKIC